MRRYITSPEDNIRLDFIIDEFVHQLKCNQGQIASVGPMNRSLQSRVFRVSAVVSAAKDLIPAVLI
jgi:hypothetical protein